MLSTFTQLLKKASSYVRGGHEIIYEDQGVQQSQKQEDIVSADFIALSECFPYLA